MKAFLHTVSQTKWLPRRLFFSPRSCHYNHQHADVVPTISDENFHWASLWIVSHSFSKINKISNGSLKRSNSKPKQMSKILGTWPKISPKVISEETTRPALKAFSLNFHHSKLLWVKSSIPQLVFMATRSIEVVHVSFPTICARRTFHLCNYQQAENLSPNEWNFFNSPSENWIHLFVFPFRMLKMEIYFSENGKLCQLALCRVGEIFKQQTILQPWSLASTSD